MFTAKNSRLYLSLQLLGFPHACQAVGARVAGRVAGRPSRAATAHVPPPPPPPPPPRVARARSAAGSAPAATGDQSAGAAAAPFRSCACDGPRVSARRPPPLPRKLVQLVTPVGEDARGSCGQSFVAVKSTCQAGVGEVRRHGAQTAEASQADERDQEDPEADYGEEEAGAYQQLPLQPEGHAD